VRLDGNLLRAEVRPDDLICDLKWAIRNATSLGPDVPIDVTNRTGDVLDDALAISDYSPLVCPHNDDFTLGLSKKFPYQARSAVVSLGAASAGGGGGIVGAASAAASKIRAIIDTGAGIGGARSEPVFESRKYLLYGFSGPIGLYPHGIRQFILKQMVGRPVCGFVQRVNRRDDYGQCIFLKLDASPDVLDEIESRLLSASESFSYEALGETAIRSLPMNRQFMVLNSGAGATCGPNSDPSYDHPLSISGDSAKSGGSGKSSAEKSKSSKKT